MAGNGERAAPLDKAAIRSLHTLALRDLIDAPGQYRRGAVFISGSEYCPPHLGRAVDATTHQLDRSRRPAYPPIVSAALTHEIFTAA